MNYGYEHARELVRRFDQHQQTIAVAPDEHDLAARAAAKIAPVCSEEGCPERAADFLSMNASPRQVRRALAAHIDANHAVAAVRDQ